MEKKKQEGGEAHRETERMEAEGESATGQVGDGEGRQLITPSPPPHTHTPHTPQSSSSSSSSPLLLSVEMIDGAAVDFVARPQIQKAPLKQMKARDTAHRNQESRAR